MRELSVTLGLQEQVNFTGMITERAKIEEAMDKADLFVLASRTEGLPRAMIEAMARGLPCIGSDVGGIPQLLEKRYLFTKEDTKGLAELLVAASGDNNKLTTMSATNIETAKQYANSVLDKERTGFYKIVQNSN
jgi:glycosyltransferase involved in cell wall biosynthesis